MGKWSKIIQFSLLLATTFCPYNIFSKNKNYIESAQSQPTVVQQAVAKQDPQEWYKKMMQKYPNAGLENVKFTSDHSWAMLSYTDGSMCIQCPFDTYESLKPFTLADEHSLLHEAGHVRNHSRTPFLYKMKYQKIIAKFVALMALGNFLRQSKNAMLDIQNKDVDYLLLFSNLYLAALLIPITYRCIPNLLSRLDETFADNFAIEHGDDQVLTAGYKKYMKHAVYQKYAYKNWLTRWMNDFTHPASYDRAKKIRNAIFLKYGQMIS